MHQAGELQQKLDLVVQTGFLLARATDLQEIVQAVMNAGLQLTGAQCGAFFYLPLDTAETGKPHVAFGGCDCSFPLPVALETDAILSENITTDPQFSKILSVEQTSIRSYLAVPVQRREGEVFGRLLYGHKEARAFDQNAESFVTTLAVQAALAMENHRLQTQSKHRLEELEHAAIFRRKADRHLAELAAIVESSDDAILSKDLNGTIRSWNDAATRIFGYEPEEIIGESILKLIPPELHEEDRIIIDKIRRGERIDHFETIRLAKDGMPLEVSLSVSPIRDSSGTVIGASKIFRTISERKRMEKMVLQAEKISAAGRMAATIAHEINNPLEAVVNLLFLARTHVSEPEKVLSFLDTAEHEISRVSYIARQTLGFYRENAAATKVSIADLVQEALAVYEPKCQETGITVRQNLHSRQRLTLRKGEIMQVLSNLVANAIYAMPNGGTLTVCAEDTSTPGEGVLLTIQDDGIGIPKEQLPRIFDAFYSTRGSMGTGIGLFIAKQLIEGHGGVIRVESSVSPENHGTRMVFFLPDSDAPMEKPRRRLVPVLSPTA